MVWISFIVFSTGGSCDSIFCLLLFPYHHGQLSLWHERWSQRGHCRRPYLWIHSISFRLGRFARSLTVSLSASVYLFFLAYIFGLLSEFETKQNQKLLALSKTAGEVAMRDERRRIAQELHDGLLQSLATHILRLETCRKKLLESPAELDRELQSIEDETRSSMKLIRQFLAGKETQSFPPGMLLENFRDDLRFLRDGLGMRVILETEPEDFNPPEIIEQDLYYVLREGLMNITRHSQASRADIIVETDRNGNTRFLKRRRYRI